MAYQALYRAYRPQKFSEVAGQKHIVKTLQNAIRLNRVAHAYLFCGPRGTGKTSIAKIMAKAINCANGMSEEPCCECDICKGITRGVIPDVVEIDAASNNGVDEIRDIRDKVKYLPSVTRYKVYIIDEVHMLSAGAFNALLKTLEEPPSHVVFILATTEPQKIPATILSRCQRFDFLGITPSDVLSNLKRVITAENINITNEALDIISEACEGGMRDALSLLDQSISYSSDDIVDEEDVLGVSGNLSAKDMIKLINSLNKGDKEKVLEDITRIIASGKEISKITSDIIGFLKDILLFKNRFGNKAIYKNEEFIKLAGEIDDFYIYFYLDELNNILNNIKSTNQKEAYLELGLIKMADSKLKTNLELEERVTSLESQISLLSSMPINKKTEEIKTQDIKDNIEVIDKSKYNKENLDIKTDDSYISVEDISKILNAGSKDKKQKVIEALNNILEKESENKVVKLLNECSVVASSNKQALFTLDSDGLANRLMKSSNYLEILELINKYDGDIEGFLCISKDTWIKISSDFRNKYSKDNPEPILNDIKILVKKFKKEDNEKDDMEKLAEELFPNMKINKEI